MTARRSTTRGRQEPAEGTFQPIEHDPVHVPDFEPIEITPPAAVSTVVADNEQES